MGTEFIIAVVLVIVGLVMFLFGGKKKVSAEALKKEEEDFFKEEPKEEVSDEDMPPISMPPNVPEINIYFGSQTGNAERFCQTLEKEAQNYGLAAKVIDMEEFEAGEVCKEGSLALVIAATHGEGDPTDNALGFWKWTRKNIKEESKCMSKVTFTAFGLGNT